MNDELLTDESAAKLLDEMCESLLKGLKRGSSNINIAVYLCALSKGSAALREKAEKEEK